MAATLLDEHTADFPPAGSDLDLIVAGCNHDNCPRVGTVRGGPGVVRMFGVVSGAAVLGVADRESVGGHGLWRRRALSWSSQLVVPVLEHQDMIRRFHDLLFAGHLGVSRTAYFLLDRAYWPGLRQDVCTYLASCAVCLARKSLCPRRAPMGHVDVGHRWDRVAMDLLDMSVTTQKGNRYVLVMVDCFSGWTEACPTA